MKDFGTTVISVDATFKDKETGDFVAIEVWSKRGVDYYLRYLINKRLDFPKTLEAIGTVMRLFPEVRYVLIEDKANGSAIIQTLQSRIHGVIGINPKGGKVSRVNAIAPAVESGHVYLPQDATFAEEFIDQFTAFPASEHDDMVDAASQCLNWMIFVKGGRDLPSAKEQRLLREASEAQEAIYSNEIYDVYNRGAMG